MTNLGRPRGRAPMSWMRRLRRAFDFDISRCSRCGAAMRVLSVITDPRVIEAILEHVLACARGAMKSV